MIFEFKVKMWQLWKKYVLNAFKHEREAYHIAYTDITNVDIIEAKLIDLGYQPNYFSFGDEGQITSMRKMYVDSDGYWRQMHIRVHEDGEVRGHDELSYEESAIEHVEGGGAQEIDGSEIVKVLKALVYY